MKWAKCWRARADEDEYFSLNVRLAEKAVISQSFMSTLRQKQPFVGTYPASRASLKHRPMNCHRRHHAIRAGKADVVHGASDVPRSKHSRYRRGSRFANADRLHQWEILNIAADLRSEIAAQAIPRVDEEGIDQPRSTVREANGS